MSESTPCQHVKLWQLVEGGGNWELLGFLEKNLKEWYKVGPYDRYK